MSPERKRSLAAVMFADMVGFTALMSQDEDAARKQRDRQREVVGRLVEQHGGQVRQFYGDGTLSVFESAVEAARCAVAIQVELQTPPHVPLRVGIHLGDVVDEGDGVYGDGVNVASRVESLASPGGVLVSDKVHDELTNHPDLVAVSLGIVPLKNVDRPVELFALTGSGLPTPSPFRRGGVVGFVHELQRRHVVRVGLLYLAAAFAVLQGAQVVVESLSLPSWTMTFLTVVVLVGFPIAVVLAWIFDVTPDGVRRSPPDSPAPTVEPLLGSSETSPPAARPPYSATNWRRLSTAAVAVAVVAVSVALFVYQRSRVRWARDLAVPEIGALIDQGRLVEAVSLGEQVERLVDDDPRLASLWPRMARKVSISTTPTGAAVEMSMVLNPTVGSEVQVDRPETWRDLGNAPIEIDRLPLGSYRLRVSAPEFDTAERIYLNPYQEAGQNQEWSVSLPAAGTIPTGMARIGARNLTLNLYGLAGNYDPTPDGGVDPAFLLGKREVTNREYEAFVRAGGYEERQYWTNDFINENGSLSWEDAMAEFRDKSGRPGPSTWEGGTYPEGRPEYPVTGVSWYEAAAYAEFVGASLPTLFHWAAAAENRGYSMGGFGNFRGEGAEPVGSTPFGPFGIYDLAGNVREWVWNSAGDTRYILGGGWSEPHYVFGHGGHAPPFDRSPSNGFRLADYNGASEEELLPLRAPVLREASFVWGGAPVEDDVFAALARAYDYDGTSLEGTVDATDDSSRYWRKEAVSYNAAYDGERVFGFLFLPKNAEPPFQTLIYFPGVGVMFDHSSDVLDGESMIDYVVKTGRAVLYPIYKDTYERYVGEQQNRNATRDYVRRKTRWIQDVRRSVDYLETRQDIDHTRLAYWGLSWGAEHAPIVLSTDRRLMAGVLMDGGAVHLNVLPEVDESHFAPRVSQPVLMLNGRYDYIFPVESAQLPLFDLLGTPDDSKTHVLFDAGHVVVNRFFEEAMAEMTGWLDRTLGTVR